MAGKSKIRVLQAVAGLDFSWSAGDEVELPSEQARAWADGERAELVDGREVAAKQSRGGGRGPKPEKR